MTLYDVAAWVGRCIVEQTPLSTPVSLLPLSGEVQAQVAWRGGPEDVARTLCVAAELSDGQGKREVLHARWRCFGGQCFLLWVEDAPERGSAVVHACDVSRNSRGRCELPDSVLREAYARFVHGLWAGLPTDFGFRRPGAGAYTASNAVAVALTAAQPPPELLQEFFASLLDAVSLHSNAFGDEWAVRVPGLSPPLRGEYLDEDLGPELLCALAPGAEPISCGGSATGHPGGAGPLPPRSPPPAAGSGRRWRPCEPGSPFAGRTSSQSLSSRLRALCSAAAEGYREGLHEGLCGRIGPGDEDCLSGREHRVIGGYLRPTVPEQQKPPWRPQRVHADHFSAAGYLGSCPCSPSTPQQKRPSSARASRRPQSCGAAAWAGGRRAAASVALAACGGQPCAAGTQLTKPAGSCPAPPALA
eukprot:TRINITY_DN31175_c0_g1_i1.p1 TRINITY_DN31175_c0_g1~~TRINITY_DN31175_c0_g1_i1.p1  ORF type:complete len:416 (+),score=55.35 TRINITY_DN31175_c0_g1_i1:104-1351(+)